MGSKVAPSVAIIFMHQFEEAALKNAPIRPDMYARFIDDSIGIWTGSHQQLLDSLEYLNSQHPSIKFTMEDTYNSGGIPFLDLHIDRC